MWRIFWAVSARPTKAQLLIISLKFIHMFNLFRLLGLKPKRKPKAETQNSSARHIANAHVVSRFSLGGASGHPSTYAAHVMISQIDNKENAYSHWLLLSLHKLIIERPDMTVKDLIFEVDILCPNASQSVTQRLIDHGMKH